MQSVWSIFFFFSSRRRHTRFDCDWSSDVCSSDLLQGPSINVPVKTDPWFVRVFHTLNQRRARLLKTKTLPIFPSWTSPASLAPVDPQTGLWSILLTNPFRYQKRPAESRS